MTYAPPTLQRRQPLPEQSPKPSADDPEAPVRIAATVASPCYREADRDPDFLQRDDMRGLRLMLDYEKPQALLVVECRHRHQHQGKLFEVHVELSLPGADIAIDRNPGKNQARRCPRRCSWRLRRSSTPGRGSRSQPSGRAAAHRIRSSLIHLNSRPCKRRYL